MSIQPKQEADHPEKQLQAFQHTHLCFYKDSKSFSLCRVKDSFFPKACLND